MKLIIEQDDSKPHYKHQKGYTYSYNGGEIQKCAKGSVVGQMVRLLVRLIDICEQVDDPGWVR